MEVETQCSFFSCIKMCYYKDHRLIHINSWKGYLVQPPAVIRVSYEVNVSFTPYTVIYDNLKSAGHCARSSITTKRLLP